MRLKRLYACLRKGIRDTAGTAILELVVAIGLMALVGSLAFDYFGVSYRTLSQLDRKQDVVEAGLSIARSTEATFRSVLESGGSLASISDTQVAASGSSSTVTLSYSGTSFTLVVTGDGARSVSFPGSGFECTSLIVNGLEGETLKQGSACSATTVRSAVVNFTLRELVTGESKTFRMSFRCKGA